MTSKPHVSTARIDDLAARVQREVDEGRSGAAQFTLALDGKVIATRSFGTAGPTSRFVIFSATKTLVAMALVGDVANGTLDLTSLVATTIPEFGANGKGDVTVLQLLTMQGGFPQAPMTPEHWGSSEGRREQFSRWHLAWPAGTRTEYHPIAAHWVIVELLESISRRPYADVVDERISSPAGIGRMLGGVGPTEDVITVHSTGERPPDHVLIDTFGRADVVPQASIGPEALLSMNHPKARAAAIPGGGAVARSDEIALIYQRFLHADAPGWADAIGTVRNGSINVTDGLPANRTIAGVVAGADGWHAHRWFPSAPRAFGHHGAGGQLCWLDPDSGLSFCFLHDTLHQDPRVDFTRSRDLNALALTCVRP